jgi:hypothetical protein
MKVFFNYEALDSSPVEYTQPTYSHSNPSAPVNKIQVKKHGADESFL